MAIAKNRIASLRQRFAETRLARDRSDRQKAGEAQRARSTSEAVAVTGALARAEAAPANPAASGGAPGAGSAAAPATARGVPGPAAPAAEPSAARPAPALTAEQTQHFSGGKYANRQATGNETFYRYWNTVTGDVGYITDRQYATLTELRRSLGIVGRIDAVLALRPPKGAWLSEGVAPARTGASGEALPGGGYLVVIPFADLIKSATTPTELPPTFFR